MNKTQPIRIWTRRLFATRGALLVGVLLLLGGASCGRDMGLSALPAAPLVELALSPSNPTVADATPPRFSLRGRFADGQIRELGPAADWTLRDAQGQPMTAAHGALEGTAPGHYTVTATYGGLVVTTALHVNALTLTKLTLTPLNPRSPKGPVRRLPSPGLFPTGRPRI